MYFYFLFLIFFACSFCFLFVLTFTCFLNYFISLDFLSPTRLLFLGTYMFSERNKLLVPNSVIEFIERTFSLHFRHRARTYPDKLVFICLHTSLPVKSLRSGLPRLQMQQVVGRTLPLFFPRIRRYSDTLPHFLRRRLRIETTYHSSLLVSHAKI